MEFSLQFSLGQDIRPVGGDFDATAFKVEQFDGFVAFSGAQNEAAGRLLTQFAFVEVEPAQVEFHLALVAGLVSSSFKSSATRRRRCRWKKSQIKIVVHAVHSNAFLALQKGEANAEFEDEGLHFAQDGSFDILFSVAVLEAQNIKQVGIAEDEVGG